MHPSCASKGDPNTCADDTDFAMLHQIYGARTDHFNPERANSLAACTGIDIRVIAGNPDMSRVSFTIYACALS